MEKKRREEKRKAEQRVKDISNFFSVLEKYPKAKNFFSFSPNDLFATNWKLVFRCLNSMNSIPKEVTEKKEEFQASFLCRYIILSLPNSFPQENLSVLKNIMSKLNENDLMLAITFTTFHLSKDLQPYFIELLPPSLSTFIVLGVFVQIPDLFIQCAQKILEMYNLFSYEYQNFVRKCFMKALLKPVIFKKLETLINGLTIKTINVSSISFLLSSFIDIFPYVHERIKPSFYKFIMESVQLSRLSPYILQFLLTETNDYIQPCLLYSQSISLIINYPALLFSYLENSNTFGQIDIVLTGVIIKINSYPFNSTTYPIIFNLLFLLHYACSKSKNLQNILHQETFISFIKKLLDSMTNHFYNIACFGMLLLIIQSYENVASFINSSLGSELYKFLDNEIDYSKILEIVLWSFDTRDFKKTCPFNLLIDEDLSNYFQSFPSCSTFMTKIFPQIFHNIIMKSFDLPAQNTIFTKVYKIIKNQIMNDPQKQFLLFSFYHSIESIVSRPGFLSNPSQDPNESEKDKLILDLVFSSLGISCPYNTFLAFSEKFPLKQNYENQLELLEKATSNLHPVSKFIILTNSLSPPISQNCCSVSIWFRSALFGTKDIIKINGKIPLICYVDEKNGNLNIQSGSNKKSISFPPSIEGWYFLTVSSTNPNQITVSLNLSFAQLNFQNEFIPWQNIEIGSNDGVMLFRSAHFFTVPFKENDIKYIFAIGPDYNHQIVNVFASQRKNPSLFIKRDGYISSMYLDFREHYSIGTSFRTDIFQQLELVYEGDLIRNPDEIKFMPFMNILEVYGGSAYLMNLANIILQTKKYHYLAPKLLSVLSNLFNRFPTFHSIFHSGKLYFLIGCFLWNRAPIDLEIERIFITHISKEVFLFNNPDIMLYWVLDSYLTNFSNPNLIKKLISSLQFDKSENSHLQNFVVVRNIQLMSQIKAYKSVIQILSRPTNHNLSNLDLLGDLILCISNSGNHQEIATYIFEMLISCHFTYCKNIDNFHSYDVTDINQHKEKDLKIPDPPFVSFKPSKPKLPNSSQDTSAITFSSQVSTLQRSVTINSALTKSAHSYEPQSLLENSSSQDNFSESAQRTTTDEYLSENCMDSIDDEIINPCEKENCNSSQHQPNQAEDELKNLNISCFHDLNQTHPETTIELLRIMKIFYQDHKYISLNLSLLIPALVNCHLSVQPYLASFLVSRLDIEYLPLLGHALSLISVQNETMDHLFKTLNDYKIEHAQHQHLEQLYSRILVALKYFAHCVKEDSNIYRQISTLCSNNVEMDIYVFDKNKPSSNQEIKELISSLNLSIDLIIEIGKLQIWTFFEQSFFLFVNILIHSLFIGSIDLFSKFFNSLLLIPNISILTLTQISFRLLNTSCTLFLQTGKFCSEDLEVLGIFSKIQSLISDLIHNILLTPYYLDKSITKLISQFIDIIGVYMPDQYYINIAIDFLSITNDKLIIRKIEENINSRPKIHEQKRYNELLNNLNPLNFRLQVLSKYTSEFAQGIAQIKARMESKEKEHINGLFQLNINAILQQAFLISQMCSSRPESLQAVKSWYNIKRKLSWPDPQWTIPFFTNNINERKILRPVSNSNFASELVYVPPQNSSIKNVIITVFANLISCYGYDSGILNLYENEILFIPSKSFQESFKIPLLSIEALQKKGDKGLNIVCKEMIVYLFFFIGISQRDQFISSTSNSYANLVSNDLQIYEEQSHVNVEAITKKWVSGELLTFDYLISLNEISGKTFCDISEYPIMPWVILPTTPIQENEHIIDTPQFSSGNIQVETSPRSNNGAFFFLSRFYGSTNFFNSYNESMDNMELACVPEFFIIPEMFNDVELPPFIKSPRELVWTLRKSLEKVSNINIWIDNLWGINKKNFSKDTALFISPHPTRCIEENSMDTINEKQDKNFMRRIKSYNKELLFIPTNMKRAPGEHPKFSSIIGGGIGMEEENGNFLVIGHELPIISLWNTKDYSFLKTVSCHKSPVTAIFICEKDWKIVASGHKDGGISIISLMPIQLLREEKGIFNEKIVMIKISSVNGDILAITEHNKIELWSVNGTFVGSMEFQSKIVDVNFTNAQEELKDNNIFILCTDCFWVLRQFDLKIIKKNPIECEKPLYIIQNNTDTAIIVFNDGFISSIKTL